LTYEVGRRLVKIDYLGIINILNNYQVNPPPDPRFPPQPAPPVVRELIQHFATPEAMAAESLRLLNDPVVRSELSEKMRHVISSLDAEGASRRAAEAILGTLS
jgi:lipid-A-disaccharide synthase